MISRPRLEDGEGGRTMHCRLKNVAAAGCLALETLTLVLLEPRHQESYSHSIKGSNVDMMLTAAFMECLLVSTVHWVVLHFTVVSLSEDIINVMLSIYVVDAKTLITSM